MSDPSAGDLIAPGEARAPSDLDPSLAAKLKRDRDGLIAAVIQQHDSGQVLMVGWMDDEALHRTLTSGRVTFWSRSRQEYWRKGDTSGHVQFVRSVALDCDGDAVLVRVDQVGAACHTGAQTCFFTDLAARPADVRPAPPKRNGLPPEEPDLAERDFELYESPRHVKFGSEDAPEPRYGVVSTGKVRGAPDPYAGAMDTHWKMGRSALQGTAMATGPQVIVKWGAGR